MKFLYFHDLLTFPLCQFFLYCALAKRGRQNKCTFMTLKINILKRSEITYGYTCIDDYTFPHSTAHSFNRLPPKCHC